MHGNDARPPVVATTRAPALRGAIGPGGYFTLAFGAIVGSGWVVVLGDWLGAAGPIGAVLGFAAGAVVMMLVALCYGELAARAPTAGGEFLYTLETLGRLPGFFVGWFLTLYSIAVCAFEGIALGWLLRTLVPEVGLGRAYGVVGSPVTWDALIIGFGGAVGVGLLHARGARSTIRFQNLVTYSFIAVSIGLIACGLSLGTVANLRPWFAAPNGQHWIGGSFWIFSTCAFFLNGWQAAYHAVEERRPDVSARSVVLHIVAAIAASGLFYGSIIVAAASAVPWRQLLSQELPAATAFRTLGADGVLGSVVLIAATISLTKTWSAMTWVSSRIVFAQARHGLLPGWLAAVDPLTGAPRAAVYCVTTLSMAGIALGRGAIVPIVNMVSICLALSIILCLVVLLRRRTSGPRPTFCVPGGTPMIVTALVCASVMIGVALVRPFLVFNRELPVEWLLLGAWALAGMVVWTGMRRVLRDPV